MKSEIKRCPKCRFPVSVLSDVKVCPKCGAEYSIKKPAKKPSRRKPKPKAKREK